MLAVFPSYSQIMCIEKRFNVLRGKDFVYLDWEELIPSYQRNGFILFWSGYDYKIKWKKEAMFKVEGEKFVPNAYAAHKIILIKEREVISLKDRIKRWFFKGNGIDKLN